MVVARGLSKDLATATMRVMTCTDWVSGNAYPNDRLKPMIWMSFGDLNQYPREGVLAAAVKPEVALHIGMAVPVVVSQVAS